MSHSEQHREKQSDSGVEAFRRIELETSGSLPFSHPIPESQRLIRDHCNNAIRHAGVSLVEINDVYLWGSNQNMCLYDALDGVYEELSLQYTPVDWNVAVGIPIVEVPGTTALFPHLAPQNYYHWLIDTMPCFGILERAGIEVDSLDQFYIHRMINEFQWSMLNMMGVGTDRVLFQKNRYAHYRFERLLIPDFRLHGGGWPHPWCAAYLRQRFTSGNSGLGDTRPDTRCQAEQARSSRQGQKIYIARGLARRSVVNEDELICRLKCLGYRIVRPHELSFEQQVYALQDADFVLASHGAGLANIVFCRPGVQLMEFCGHYITVHFRMLAEYCGAEYRAVAAGLDEQGNRLPVSSSGEVRHDDFRADLDEIINQAERFAARSSDLQMAI